MRSNAVLRTPHRGFIAHTELADLAHGCRTPGSATRCRPLAGEPTLGGMRSRSPCALLIKTGGYGEPETGSPCVLVIRVPGRKADLAAGARGTARRGYHRDPGCSGGSLIPGATPPASRCSAQAGAPGGPGRHLVAPAAGERRRWAGARYGLASYTRLNGVWLARRKRVRPPRVTTSRTRAWPACAPSASPTSCDSDAGVHSRVEKP